MFGTGKCGMSLLSCIRKSPDAFKYMFVFQTLYLKLILAEYCIREISINVIHISKQIQIQNLQWLLIYNMDT